MLEVYEFSFSTFTSAGELDLTSELKTMRSESIKALQRLKHVFADRRHLKRIELIPGVDRGMCGGEVVVLHRP